MDNPLVFLLAIIGLFFGMWLLGGGQHWPISYQGPFITPVTNVGQTQVGYGPQISASSSLSLPGSGSVSTSVGKTAPASPYAKTISLAHTTQPNVSNPNGQYLEFTISSRATSPVSLDAWKFVSTATHSTAYISGSGATIQPGQTIFVVSKFPSTDAHDTMQLYDGSGALVTSVSF